MNYILAIFISYLLGSIPVGLFLTRLAGKGDIRRVGSGNIGATNVMRVGGLRLAAATWLLDMLKAMIAVWVGYWLVGDNFGAWCGFFAVVGHCFPVWLRFHGGKGISCLFGVVFAVSPLIFVISGVEWLLIALTTGFSSLGAIVVFCILPLLGFLVNIHIGFAFLAIALLCLLRHYQNIMRLVNGTESRVEWKWKK